MNISTEPDSPSFYILFIPEYGINNQGKTNCANTIVKRERLKKLD